MSAPAPVTTIERPRRRQRRWTGRRQARMLAFQVLFGLDLNSRPPEVAIVYTLILSFDILDLTSQPPDEAFSQRLAAAGTVSVPVAAYETMLVEATRQILVRKCRFWAVMDYVTTLVQGAWASLPDIDTRLASAAPAWPLSQMARVDKSILRLAIYELLYRADVPDRVAINEAIELAKVFGHDTSARFVNGVLGTIQAEKETAAAATGGSEELPTP